MLEIAKSVATGEKLFGKYEATQGAVLIIDGESGEQELKKRMQQMSFSRNLPIYVISEQGIKIDDPNTLRFIHSKTQELNIKLVVFDPLSAMHSKTENNAEDMQVVMESMASLTNKGVTVLFLHHHRKESSFGQSSMSQNLRGSSVILSRVDSQTVIINKGDEGTNTRIRYSQEKMRNGKREKAFELFLTEDDTGIYLKHAGEVEVEESKMNKAIEFIPTTLKEEGKTKEEICQILKKNDIQARTTSTALRKLEKSGQIKKARKGKKNFYTLPNEVDF
jgi:RecA-family ATPase